MLSINLYLNKINIQKSKSVTIQDYTIFKTYINKQNDIYHNTTLLQNFMLRLKATKYYLLVSRLAGLTVGSIQVPLR